METHDVHESDVKVSTPACCETVLLSTCCGTEHKPDCCGQQEAPSVCGCGGTNHSTAGSGDSAGPEITSPLGLNREP